MLKNENDYAFIKNENKGSVKNNKLWKYRLGHLSIENIKQLRTFWFF